MVEEEKRKGTGGEQEEGEKQEVRMTHSLDLWCIMQSVSRFDGFILALGERTGHIHI